MKNGASSPPRLSAEEVRGNPAAFESYKKQVRSLVLRSLIDPRYSLAQKRGLLNIVANFSKEATRKRSLMLREYGIGPEGYVIGLTDRCNLQCRYCYSESATTGGATLDAVAVSLILSEMRETFGIRFVTISGGEPFPDVLDIACRHRNITFYTYTNGTYIGQDTSRALKRLGNIIPAVTLVGTKKQHEYVRGEGTYDSVMDAIRHLKLHNIIWGLSVTESRINVRSLLHEGLLKNLCDLRPHFVRMIPYVSSGRRDEVPLALSKDESYHLGKLISEFRRQSKTIIHDYVNDDTLGIKCMAGGVRYFYVDPQMRLSPCVFMDCGEQIHVSPDGCRTNILDLLTTSELFVRARQLQRACPKCIVRDIRNWRRAIYTHSTPAGRNATLSSS